MLVAKKENLVEAFQITEKIYDAIADAIAEGLCFYELLDVPEWLRELIGEEQVFLEDDYLKLRNECGRLVSVLFEGDWLVKGAAPLPVVYRNRSFRKLFWWLAEDTVGEKVRKGTV